MTWLRSHAISLAVCCLGLAALYVVLRLVALGHALSLLIVLTMLLFMVAAAVLDYLHEHAYYRSLHALTQSGDEALSLVDQIERPNSPQGQISYDAIELLGTQANQEVARMRRLASDNREFVEAWVHEVKTPLAAADLLIENLDDPRLRPVASELDRIDAYAEQALFYARANSVDRDYLIRTCELARLVSDAAKSRAHALIGAGMSVSMEGLERTVYADPKWMGFVLGQVIDNAIKYRRDADGDGGPDAGERASILFRGTVQGEGTANERVVLTVRDNGCGISAADIGRIFDRGFTGANGRTHAKSTGMGLYLVRLLCDKMGLSVRASSVQGEWTAIDIVFPTNRMQLFE